MTFTCLINVWAVRAALNNQMGHSMCVILFIHTITSRWAKVTCKPRGNKIQNNTVKTCSFDYFQGMLGCFLKGIFVADQLNEKNRDVS